jgi:hypothetical protein
LPAALACLRAKPNTQPNFAFILKLPEKLPASSGTQNKRVNGKIKITYYLLTIPYSHDAELVMEILKYGNNVEVLAPAALKGRVKDKLKGALQYY